MFGPFLLQDLNHTREELLVPGLITLFSIALVSNNQMFIYLYEDHVEFRNVHSLFLQMNTKTVTSVSSSTRSVHKLSYPTIM